MDNFPEISRESPSVIDNSTCISSDDANNQQIGVSRGGRTTKIHALAGKNGKPVALMLTAGNINDCSAAEDLLALTAIEGKTILGDKAYATKDIMDYILENGATLHSAEVEHERTLGI